MRLLYAESVCDGCGRIAVEIAADENVALALGEGMQKIVQKLDEFAIFVFLGYTFRVGKELLGFFKAERDLTAAALFRFHFSMIP